MFSKMTIAVSAALILGAASAALASNEHDDSVSETQAAREMRGSQLPWWWNTPKQGRGGFSNSRNAYGYVASPVQQEGLARRKSRNR
jgi:hypothetical protein